MTEKERAATVCSGSGKERVDFNCLNYSRESTDCQSVRLLGLVESTLAASGAFGAEHARPSSEVMLMVGICRERDFREVVERERRDGALILASGRGLFLPAQGEKGHAELLRYVHLGEARIKGQARALRRARQALKQLEGQIELSEVES